MSSKPIVLASTWNPRGELPRLEHLLPQLEQVYRDLVLVVGRETSPEIVASLVKLGFQHLPETSGETGEHGNLQPPVPGSSKWMVVVQDWSWGRFAALQAALHSPASYVHYADLDRLLRWVETRPGEWREMVSQDGITGCLIHGRTPAAYATHPQALVQTEAISNAVVSHLLGLPVDASAGSKCFTRQAVEFLVAHTRPGNALGTDAEWPVLLQRGGFGVEFLAVDGLDWEIPDQYQPEAAGRERQARVAKAYDAEPQNWAHRVAVALEIVRSGLEASQTALPPLR